MLRAFVDTSVFFSACYSVTGASFEIFRLALNGAVELVTSEYVLEEVRRNLAAKSPESLPQLVRFLELIRFEVANPTLDNVLAAAKYTELIDAPVVAAAQLANAEYLVSLDRRHLVGQLQVSQSAGLSIVLPRELLTAIRDNVIGGQSDLNLD